MNRMRKRLGVAVLLHPAEVSLTLSLLTVSLVFTAFPGFLEHSPVAFETRGLVHHAWHYTLLAGSATALAGLLLFDHAWARSMRLYGLLALVLVVLLNLIAAVTEDLTRPGVSTGGLDLALRVSTIGFLSLRIRTIVRPPIVELSTRDTA
jgi:hypothetical protein